MWFPRQDQWQSTTALHQADHRGGCGRTWPSAEVPGGDKIPYVIAYHEIIEAPGKVGTYDPERCDDL